MEPDYETLDEGIRRYVRILRESGIETFESCEGGGGHAFLEPTIRFHGDSAEGYKAVTIALQHGLPVANLRRAWSVQGGELNGATWEMTFWQRDNAGDKPVCDICCQEYTGYMVPDEIWRRVYPDGSGLLCLDCLTARLDAMGKYPGGWLVYPAGEPTEITDIQSLKVEHRRLLDQLEFIRLNLEEFSYPEWYQAKNQTTDTPD